MPSLTTADDVVNALHAVADAAEAAKIRMRVEPNEPVIGVRMGTLFELAKSAVDLTSAELDELFDDPAYEPRMVAFCVLDFRARRRMTAAQSAALAQTYLHRHDAITAWDMVDRAAPRVLGQAILADVIDGAVLDELARDPDPLRRRSAITAPLWFIRHGAIADVERGLAIAAMLDADDHARVRSAVTIYRRHAAAAGAR